MGCVVDIIFQSLSIEQRSRKLWIKRIKTMAFGAAIIGIIVFVLLVSFESFQLNEDDELTLNNIVAKDINNEHSKSIDEAMHGQNITINEQRIKDKANKDVGNE